MERSGSGKIVKRIELDDVISIPSKSECRFLHYSNGKLFIVDLGLDIVYVINISHIFDLMDQDNVSLIYHFSLYICMQFFKCATPCTHTLMITS